ncbi:MAG: hypothetical protein FAF03_05180 [Epsilonproteobacteria bacterium]|nr:hypothetical protein [Campylobacterota bacterium]
MLKKILLLSLFVFTGCTNSSLTPISNAKASNYTGEATILIAVDGTDDRNVRHIELGTKEEPEGYEIYFHEKKYSEGFIVVTLPTPSTKVRLVEYSLTGMYGCSRGKAGYGYGTKTVSHIENGKTYFLGTINTSMNTMYKEMPDELMKEAKEKYNYTPHGTDIKKKSTFQSNIKL